MVWKFENIFRNVYSSQFVTVLYDRMCKHDYGIISLILTRNIFVPASQFQTSKYAFFINHLLIQLACKGKNVHYMMPCELIAVLRYHRVLILRNDSSLGYGRLFLICKKIVIFTMNNAKNFEYCWMRQRAYLFWYEDDYRNRSRSSRG